MRRAINWNSGGQTDIELPINGIYGSSILHENVSLRAYSWELYEKITEPTLLFIDRFKSGATSRFLAELNVSSGSFASQESVLARRHLTSGMRIIHVLEVYLLCSFYGHGRQI